MNKTQINNINVMDYALLLKPNCHSQWDGGTKSKVGSLGFLVPLPSKCVFLQRSIKGVSTASGVVRFVGTTTTGRGQSHRSAKAGGTRVSDPVAAAAQFSVGTGDRIIGSASTVPSFCLLWSPPTFRCIDIQISLLSWCTGQGNLCWVIDVLLVVDWKSEGKEASHTTMMLTSLSLTMF